MKCWYCNSEEHEDIPCPQRVKDVDRFVESGRAMYDHLWSDESSRQFIESWKKPDFREKIKNHQDAMNKFFEK